MVPDTASRQALVEWMAEDPTVRTQTAIAKAIGVSQPSVADWINRNARPKPKYRPKLHRLTGGRSHRDGWLTEEEEAEAAAIKPMRRTGTG